MFAPRCFGVCVLIQLVYEIRACHFLRWMRLPCCSRGSRDRDAHQSHQHINITEPSLQTILFRNINNTISLTLLPPHRQSRQHIASIATQVQTPEQDDARSDAPGFHTSASAIMCNSSMMLCCVRFCVCDPDDALGEVGMQRPDDFHNRPSICRDGMKGIGLRIYRTFRPVSSWAPPPGSSGNDHSNGEVNLNGTGTSSNHDGNGDPNGSRNTPANQDANAINRSENSGPSNRKTLNANAGPSSTRNATEHASNERSIPASDPVPSTIWWKGKVFLSRRNLRSYRDGRQSAIGVVPSSSDPPSGSWQGRVRVKRPFNSLRDAFRAGRSRSFTATAGSPERAASEPPAPPRPAIKVLPDSGRIVKLPTMFQTGDVPDAEQPTTKPSSSQVPSKDAQIPTTTLPKYKVASKADTHGAATGPVCKFVIKTPHKPAHKPAQTASPNITDQPVLKPSQPAKTNTTENLESLPKKSTKAADRMEQLDLQIESIALAMGYGPPIPIMASESFSEAAGSDHYGLAVAKTQEDLGKWEKAQRRQRARSMESSESSGGSWD